MKAGFEMMFGILKNFVMEERPIPLAYEREEVLHKEIGTPVMGDEDFITVDPGECRKLLFDGETLFNAFPRYRIEGGKDALVAFTDIL